MAFDDDCDDGPTCSLCGGPLGLLGRLGRLLHWLCRDCGMQSSTAADD